jgi:hypothetical protein
MELAEERTRKLVDAFEGPFRRSLIRSLRLGVFWMIVSTSILSLGCWGVSLFSASEFAPVVTVLVLGFAFIVGLLAFGLDMLSNVFALGLLPLWYRIAKEQTE